MSDNEDENFCYFGKPLDPYDEDAFPKRRPITVEEQIATDAQGRRRFHGAFTGGFSAGFFNTVGSLEGWSPSEFKSTRQEKAQGMTQKPEDFMDEEDLGEYGIAPQVVRATKDYSTSKKRRKQVFSEGPIPGQPVLETLLTSGNETVGYLLLKNIGLKEKIEKHLDEVNSTTRMYGCQMPVECRIPQKIENKQYQIPEIYRECLDKPKSNTFGLGYRGLDRSHVNLFKSSNLVVTDKNNKKFSIGGQAFGVGAFEEDDDDIYMREDMSNYDFELKKEKSSSSTKQQHGELLFGIFKPSKNKLIFKMVYPPPTIPHSFVGKHKVKKSRFEPIAEATEEVNRASINPNIRAKYLGEETPEVYTQSQPMKDKESPKTVKKSVEENKSTNSFDALSLMSDRFVSASLKEDVTNILEPVEKSETTHGTKDMRDAVKMKMFGRLTRVTEDWHPCSCLCKRFNVPEPFMDKPEAKNRKRTKNLIFENQKYIDDVDSFKPGVTTSASETKEDEGEENILLPSQQTSSNESQTNADSVLKTEIKIELAEDPESVEKVVEVENESSPKDITDRIGIEEKTDLFKAVFLSSSESESEDDEEEKEKSDKEKIEEFKETLLSEQLIPKIKPLKEGILSNLNFHPFSLPKPAPEELPKTATTSLESKIDDSSYGPQLPSEKVLGKSELFKLSSDSDDDWVEKDSNEKKKKSKHKKKNKKKEKYKHKKDKKSKK